MLSFEKAEFYDTFISRDEEQVLETLRQYEQSNDYLSLAEQREWAEDTVYTELISSLLNTDYMIHIENKVYRINAHTGYVYTLPAEYINDDAAITALRNEDLTYDAISRHSVEEDLWEISGLPFDKSGPGSGCPTIQAGQTLHDPDKWLMPYYNTNYGCSVGNGTGSVTLWCYPRYYRYGILFELLMRSKETDLPSLSPQSGKTCNSIILHSLKLEFRRNKHATPFYFAPTTKTGNGEVKYKPYSGVNRLCWFIWKGKTSRPDINKESPIATIKWNYTE
jgi:hypothetical protein